VPVPKRDEPAFGLFLEFLDAAWIERFFSPAQQRFRKLSMEVRVDEDPVWDRGQLFEWKSHSGAWRLPHALWTSAYWSPSMGGANQGETVTADAAVQQLERTVRRVLSETGRMVFIDQFLVEDFTPGFERHAKIPKEQIGEFLARAAPVLSEHTAGYALWTWRDYRRQAIVNSEFIDGLQDWRVNGARIGSAGGVELDNGGWIEQAVTINQYYDFPTHPADAELCVAGRSTASPHAEIAVTDEESATPLGTLSLPAQLSNVCLRQPISPQMSLRFTARAAVSITRVQSARFVQQSGMRDLQGARKAIADDYLALNQKLTVRPSPRAVSLDVNALMGRYLAKGLPRLATHDLTLTLKSDVPASWGIRSQMSVVVDGKEVGTFECGSQLVRFAVPDGEKPVALRIEAPGTRQMPPDQRDLSCHLSRVTLERSNDALGEHEQRPLYVDGWMGRHFTARLPRPPTNGVALNVRSYLPHDWPVRPRMSVFANGQSVGVFSCGADNVRLRMPDGSADFEIRMEASVVHQSAGDDRELGCLVSGLELEASAP
jgi:hypothetical protein